jgi:tetratricopeptide (TPR) repeat protein
LRYHLQLARSLLMSRETVEARQVIEAILNRSQAQIRRHADEMEQLRLEVREQAAKDHGFAGKHDVPHRRGAPRLTTGQLEQVDVQMRRAIARHRRINTRLLPRARLMLGVLEYFEGNTSRALENLLEAEAGNPALPGLHGQIGRRYLRMKQWTEAERAFRTALQIDSDNARAHHDLSVALLRTVRYVDAADHALKATELVYSYPRAHYHLAVALVRLDRTAQAVQAFDIALSQAPGMIGAHKWLGRLCRRELSEPDRAHYHNTMAGRLTKARVARARDES